MLHNASDSSGDGVWAPGLSTFARNLLLNSYGAGHGIDHDDGSEMWADVNNVVGFSHACKGNFGSNRNCSGNMVFAPGLKSMFSTETSGGGPCAEQTNNGHGSTFANKYFEGNTCIQPLVPGEAAPAYLFESCDTHRLNETVWGTRGNQYWVPNGTSVYVPCGHDKLSLADWKGKFGQDLGASMRPIPPTSEVFETARSLLNLG